MVDEKDKERDNLLKVLDKHRKTIPDKYNQVKLMSYIFEDDIDLLLSITTRGDGKSYNYLLSMLKLAEANSGFKFMIISRHYTLRLAYWELIDKILTENGYSPKNVSVRRTDFYIEVFLKNESVCLITDLGAATDLKYSSNVLKAYRLIVYDEFIAIEGDYMPDEMQRLKVIYESVDRGDPNDYLIKSPKIMLIGNPENFNSPLLSGFKLFGALEKQPINTVQNHGHVIIERFRNENVNEEKNTRLFGTVNNTSITGEFKINNFLIAPEKLQVSAPKKIVIRLDDNTNLVIHYQSEEFYFLQIEYDNSEDYDYATSLVDLKDGVRYLDSTYNISSGHLDFESGSILFSDMFTITYFDKHKELQGIDYQAIIGENMSTISRKGKAFRMIDDEERMLTLTKKRLLNDYFKK